MVLMKDVAFWTLKTIFSSARLCCLSVQETLFFLPQQLPSGHDWCFVAPHIFTVMCICIDCTVRGNVVSPWKLKLSNDDDKVMLLASPHLKIITKWSLCAHLIQF